MTYFDIFKTYSKGDGYADRFLTRAETLEGLQSKRFDVLVVGGGIHGATFARLAALNGLKTALLERDDYAFHTSSRSSKMAHGGLRYLELLDFAQVREGIRARDDLYESAGHLVHPYEFFIPVERGRLLDRIKFELGLSIYDWFTSRSASRHRWMSGPSLREIPAPLRQRVDGGFVYSDGIMNDARLTIENIVAARQEGAYCLNYASVESVSQRDDGSCVVGWTDRVRGERNEMRVGIVVNCAGPWAPLMARISPNELTRRTRYSQGIHLLFSRPWTGPALFLPLGGRGRYYFVWPHPEGTLVGTTERRVDRLVHDPMPTAQEIDEVLGRIEKDLPGEGLTRSSLIYCFAGVRTLVLRTSDGDVSRLSRRHQWSYSSGILTLLGGKFTTASMTCAEGLEEMYRIAEVDLPRAELRRRPLPGWHDFSQRCDIFRRAAAESGASRDLVERAVSRFGAQSSLFIESPRGLESVGDRLLRGEISYTIEVEQAHTLEDILRRRLGVEYSYDNGVSLLDPLVGILSEMRPEENWGQQAQEYATRIRGVRDLCAGTSA